MENKKLRKERSPRKEKSPSRFWKKLASGCLLFGAGLIAGSRMEILLQNKGISPTQCEFVTVGSVEPEQVPTKGKK